MGALFSGVVPGIGNGPDCKSGALREHCRFESYPPHFADDHLAQWQSSWLLTSGFQVRVLGWSLMDR